MRQPPIRATRVCPTLINSAPPHRLGGGEAESVPRLQGQAWHDDRRARAATALAARAASGAPLARRGDSPVALILVVDDVAPNRELIVGLLEPSGHRVLQADNGAQALDTVRAEAPDLVICDILMPVMDGYEFVRRLRQEPALSATEVVFYSATYLEQEARALAAACGVVDILPKPCEPQDILDLVGRALARASHRARPQGPGAAAPAFEREHLRLMTDKLAQKAEQLDASNRRLSALTALDLQLASERDPRRLLEEFCHGARALFGARGAVLAAVEPHGPGTVFCCVSGLGPAAQAAAAGLAPQLGLLGEALRERQPRRFKRGEGGALVAALGGELAPQRCGLVAPVQSLQHSHGWILLLDKLGADAFDEDDERSLAVHAAQAGRIYENGSLYRKVQQQLEQLRAQSAERERAALLLGLEHAVARALADAESAAGGVDAVLQAFCQSQRWSVGRFWQADEAAAVLQETGCWRAQDGPDAGPAPPCQPVRLHRGEGLAGWVWETGEPVWVPDLQRDPRLAQRSLVDVEKAASAYLLPVPSAGRVLGVLAFLGRQPRAPDTRLQASSRVVAHQLGQFLHRKEAERALQSSEQFAHATLDALPEHIAVLDERGRLLALNRAWRDFVALHGDVPLHGREGEDYAEVCARSPGLEPAALAEGLRRLLGGEQDAFALEVRCDTAAGPRWFVARLSRFAGQGPVRVVLAHEDVTAAKQAEERIRRLHRMATVLSAINSLIVRVRDRKELFQSACRIAIDNGRFKRAWVGSFQRAPWGAAMEAACADDGDEAYFERVRETLPGYFQEGDVRYHQIIERRRPLIENDIASSPWMAMREAALASGSRSLAALPLVLAQRTVAVLVLHADEPDFFDDEECRLLEELAGDMSFALDHIAQAERLDRLAYYDTLTGQANSMLFSERLGTFLATAAQSRQRLALALIDIEHFKALNDRFGRHAGDEVLRRTAERLVAWLGDATRLARVGPDQFAAVFPDAPGEVEVARRLAELYQACFGPAFEAGGQTLRVAAHIGCAVYPNDGSVAEPLFRHAEAAAKQARRGVERVLFHDPRVTESLSEKLALEDRLRGALQDDRFVLHYQPKVDSATRQIVGVEALIRWQDPELGLVPPARFIPLMEETGLVVEVGAWVLRRAVQDRRRWLALGLAAPRVAVNVSPIQLRRADFVATVEAALGAASGDPGIDIEITESAIVEDIGATIAKLGTLCARGIEVGIDDFGTGYSSLAYLARLPVQVLKIDRTFVSTVVEDPGSRTLVSTMVSLAHALSMRVVAEGVEREDQAALLHRLDCDQLQGYLVSRPLPAAALEKLLGERAGTG